MFSAWSEDCAFNKIFTPGYNPELRPVQAPDETVHLDYNFYFRALGGLVRLLHPLLFCLLFYH